MLKELLTNDCSLDLNAAIIRLYALHVFLWLSGRALCQQRKRLWVQFPRKHILMKKFKQCIT